MKAFSNAKLSSTYKVFRLTIVCVCVPGMESDWELELIHIKTGVKHFVAMKPGDMVLYESCKLVHGRPRPLNGTRYASTRSQILSMIHAMSFVIL